jgi:squalene cyclase
MAALVGGMRNSMNMIARGEEQFITPQHWREYIQSLLDAQDDTGRWTVAENPMELPPEEQVEFIQFPWALALASLALDFQLFPECQTKNSLQAFDKGAQAFSLKGFGEDDVFQVCEILMIFIEGQLPQWLKTHDRPSALQDQLEQWHQDFQKKLDSGNTVLPYGGDYSPIFKEILQGLNLG